MIGFLFSAAGRGGANAVAGADPLVILFFVAAGAVFLGIGCYFLVAESDDPDYAGDFS